MKPFILPLLTIVMFQTITAFCCLLALTLLLRAAWTDRSARLIENWVSLALVLLFLAWALPTWFWQAQPPVSIAGHVVTGVVAFIIGFGLWSLRLFGGGDVKLVAAVSLWAGPVWIAPTVLIITMGGAVLALGLLLGQRFLPATADTLFGPQSQVQASEGWAGDEAIVGNPNPSRPSVPYGIAIALGGLIPLTNIFFHHGIG